MNIAITVVVDDVYYELCFIDKVGTQIPSHIGEERRIHALQDTTAVIHGDCERSEQPRLMFTTGGNVGI